MSDLETRLLHEILAVRAIDCHSHVPAESPHAKTLADLLGYHYYTELAHSAGMPVEAVHPHTSGADRITEMVSRLDTIDNTVQYSWLMEAARDLFGFRADRLTTGNWAELGQTVVEAAKNEDRYRTVLARANLEKVFLTNRFDEDLALVDRSVFVPCLRTDDLVFQLADPDVRHRLTVKTGVEVDSAGDVRDAVRWLMRYFTQHGAASAAISLPPDFAPATPDEAAADKALARALRGKDLSDAESRHLAVFAFDVVAEVCHQFHKPFQLMIGVLRNVYPAGVEGGRDLLSKSGSLIQYADLFRRHPDVDFTVSVLSLAWAHELATFAWIFPNVKPSGHWWYLNVPVHIESELRARLMAVPKVKLIGYYSDMYKVEFGLPKFNMYRRVLARVLARDFVETGLMSEQQAAETARLLLRDNPKRIFGV
ncbi:MAG TPA: glucuronate isomerase [Phycisphaerae bacterium]|nr:glucuronate isomerase [Phycisphaerae bacterium]